MRLSLAAGVLVAWSVAAAQTPPHLDVPYVPSPNPVVEGMLKLAGVKSGDTVYDLGCGDGRIVITAAKTYGAKGVGVDINPERIEEARSNAKSAKVEDKVKFEENDLFKANIANATVVTLYLLPDVNVRLKPKLLKELKPGTRIVSHSFDMGDWKPEKDELIEGRHIYLWTVPKQ
jgi:ubiquinone/menaquinone biosynthesis C-methylase UbiE